MPSTKARINRSSTRWRTTRLFSLLARLKLRLFTPERLKSTRILSFKAWRVSSFRVSEALARVTAVAVVAVAEVAGVVAAAEAVAGVVDLAVAAAKTAKTAKLP